VGSCDKFNEPSGSINGGYLDQLSECQLFKYCAPRSELVPDARKVQISDVNLPVGYRMSVVISKDEL
jgi:hypothetical protein